MRVKNASKLRANLCMLVGDTAYSLGVDNAAKTAYYTYNSGRRWNKDSFTKEKASKAMARSKSIERSQKR